MNGRRDSSGQRFPRRSRAQGVGFLVLFVAAILLIALEAVAFATLAYRLGGGILYFIFLVLARVVALPVGRFARTCWLRFKIHTSLDGRVVLARDPRPPVVYLRSFPVDDLLSRVGHQGLDPFRTFEQQLLRAFSPIGPVIALGRPGDSIPPAGIPRIYVGDTWRQEVKDLVDSSGLILIGAGRGESLRWEIELVTRTVSPQRIVILLPFDNQGYDDFRTSTDDLFPHPLPDFPSLLKRRGDLRAAVYFDAAWTPSIVPFSVGRSRSLESEVLRQLAPVYDHLNDANAPARYEWRTTTRELYLYGTTTTAIMVVALGLFLLVVRP